MSKVQIQDQDEKYGVFNFHQEYGLCEFHLLTPFLANLYPNVKVHNYCKDLMIAS